MIKAIIIDDEQKSRETLRLLISNYHPDVQIIAEANNVDDGLKAIKKHTFDLLFLDIQMPGKDGFELLKSLVNISFKIIFTTAFDKYAINAIKFSALDYLLKPIDNRELTLAIDKVKKSKEINAPHLSINSFKKVLDENNVMKKIAIPTLNDVCFYEVKKISYLRSDNNYTIIHLDGEPPVLSSKNIGYYEDILCAHFFYRVHNSSLININRVSKFIKGKSGYVELDSGVKIEVSVRRKEQLLKLLGLE